MRFRFSFRMFGFVAAAVLGTCPLIARADCSLTSTGNVPLDDLGQGTYGGFAGGLYPNGANTRPAQHNSSGLTIASEVRPLNASGSPDPNGKIVMISVGMSNATEEFASDGSFSFKPQADSDLTKNPHLVIVDGAQSGMDATQWLNIHAATWQTLNGRLTASGVTPAQVQVVWLKQALIDPVNYGAFPAHAQVLQQDLETIIRNMKVLYPNILMAFLSSRTRAYTTDLAAENPEPFAYESGFAVQWTIADQINGTGNLNFDPTKGPVVAPYLAWGPYIWADGTNPRSDGFVWLCSDLQSDFIHPTATGGVPKVADQLLAYFKTDPIATPWFLNHSFTGRAPHITTATATPASGTPGVRVQFTARANDPDGTAVSYVWTFDDGTFSDSQNPVKSFDVPGTYNPHLTVCDQDGDFVTTTVPVSVSTLGSCTSNGNWNATGTSSTITATAQKITVSAGNPGVLRLSTSVSGPGGVAQKYSINGGSFTSFSNGATITVSNSQTLNFEITGSNPGGTIVGTIYDNTTNAAVATVNITNTNTTVASCTSSGNWNATGGSSTIAATPQTITVPAGNPGALRLSTSVSGPGGATQRYSINGGTFITFSNGATITVSNGQTLNFEITGSSPGNAVAGTIYDYTTNAAVGTVGIANNGSGGSCTSSGNWDATGTSNTITTAAQTITVPAGNPGTLRLSTSVSGPHGAAQKYSINGGAFTTFSDGATITLSNGQTLSFQITGSNPGGAVSGSVFDNTTNATIGTVSIFNSN